MNNWMLYTKAGNISCETAEKWLINHGIPFDKQSIFRLTIPELRRLAQLCPSGAKDLVYAEPNSFEINNPQKANEKSVVNEIRSGNLSDDDIISLLSERQYLVVPPILTDFENILIGYNYETMVSTFRNIKVKDVYMA